MHLLLLKNLVVSMAVGSVLTSTMSTVPNATTAANSYPNAIPQGISLEKGAAKIASPLDAWIDKLVQFESEGKANIKILDDNGQYSYGCLQFQEWTFRNYGQKYGLFSGDDITPSIYDCDLQKSIAKKMIEEDADNWRHWYTSVMTRKLGTPPVSIAKKAD